MLICILTNVCKKQDENLTSEKPRVKEMIDEQHPMIVTVSQALTSVSNFNQLFLEKCFDFFYASIWWCLLITRIVTIHEQTLLQFLMGVCVFNYVEAFLATVAFLIADLLMLVVVYCAIFCYIPILRLLLDICIRMEQSYMVIYQLLHW